MGKMQEKHLLSYKQLLAVLFSLIGLTGLTVFASQINFGALNIFIALIIAAFKASLVALFFMHLKYESGLIKGTFLTTLAMLSICVGLMLIDVAFR